MNDEKQYFYFFTLNKNKQMEEIKRMHDRSGETKTMNSDIFDRENGA